jgi:hypothetical protein
MSGIDSYTKLMLHMNDVGLTDSSDSAHEVTLNGGAARSAIESKFGGYSLYVDGDGDYLSISDSEDFNFGSDDFTIDFWVRFDDVAASYLVNQYEWPLVDGSWAVFLDSTDKISAAISFDGTTRSLIAANSVAVSDTWYKANRRNSKFQCIE